MVRISSILWLCANFAPLYASPNIWGSSSEAPVSPDALSPGDTSVVVRPINPGDSQLVSQTYDLLGKNCGSENIRSQQDENGSVSWTVTLSDSKSTRHLMRAPGLLIGDSAKKSVMAFAKRQEPSGRDTSYNIVVMDRNNTDQTAATSEFLKKIRSNQDDTFLEFRNPTTKLIFGWGNIELNDEAKKEVEANPGVKAVAPNPQLQNDLAPVIEDAAHVTFKKKSAHSAIHTKSELAVKRGETLVERDSTWVKQKDAGWPLVMLSQPKYVASRYEFCSWKNIITLFLER